jgi:hypothetical protein
MNLLLTIKRQIGMQYLLRNTATALIVLMVPSIALASSWSPTLLVNTEAFQTIDDGDGSTNIELRFGTTGSGLILNVSEEQFEFDANVEVQGTLSGNIIHAQDSFTSSGNLVIKGTTTLSGAVTINDEATFGSGIIINGVTYIFPFGDASSTGKLLASDGNGNLSWTAAGSTPNTFQTLSISGQDDIVSDQASDTLTFVASSNITITTNASTDTITIAAADTSQQTTFTLSGDGGGSDQTISHGNTLEIAGGASITTTASATDTLTVDVTDDSIDGSELADTITLDAATTFTLGSNNLIFDATSSGFFNVVGTASGRTIHAQDLLTSSGTLIVEGQVTLANTTSCTNLTTNSAGVLACNNTDYIEESELTNEAQLETQLGGIDVIVSTELNELVDDQVNALFQAGSGIFLEYDDSGGTLTVHTGFSSGAQVSLSPEYAGAVYYGDGGNNVGQMVLAYDSSNKENFYKWTSTLSSLQDYNISVRVKVPEDFDHWDGSVPLQFRYRTNAASANDNQIDITMLDTAGSSVSLTGGVNFANTSWTTATITGPEAAGTYTPGSYITILIAMQARTTNDGEAHAGFLNINWHTEP